MNRYVSVVVNGKLDVWTGNNPDKDPEAKRKALERAEFLRRGGDTAYAVLVSEIREEPKEKTMPQLERREPESPRHEEGCRGISSYDSAYDELREAMARLLGVIEAHECTCFSCDRDGQTYCDCLQREANRARGVLPPNGR